MLGNLFFHPTLYDHLKIFTNILNVFIQSQLEKVHHKKVIGAE